MPLIFIDESGQFTKRKGEKYFVVGSSTVGNPRRTEKQFRSWQRRKFPRKMRGQQEIKFSEVNISDNLRIKTLKFIANLDVRISYTYLLRRNIPYNYWRKERLQTGLLYTNIIGETLEMYLPVNDKEFRVFCDERHLKGIKRSQFKKMLKARMLPQLPQGSIVQIEMIDSKKNTNIQIADWIVGALAKHYERKELGEKCFQAIRHNIIGTGKELFTGSNKIIKQKPQSDD